MPSAHNERRARILLGTLVDIAIEAPSRQLAHDALAAAFGRIECIHRAMSLHDAGSELCRINDGAHRGTMPLSPDVRAVLGCALELSAQSEGAFDPTVGGFVASLGFLPVHVAREAGATWRDVALSDAGVRFARPLSLDFGGIAKGFAVDRALEALRDHGVTSARVNAGGDLRVWGERPEPIHVRTGGPHGIAVPLAALGDGAVATSCYAQQRRRVRGRLATPLVDPRAGLPSMTTRTVSVLAPTCMIADALTKVVALRGARASAMLARHDAAAVVFAASAGVWRCKRLPETGRHAHRS